MITYDDFKKLDLRVAKILEAVRVEGSDKLVKLQIDVGEIGQRQLVAGIGTVYAPEILVGKQIVIVANLEPKTFTLRLGSGQVVLESNGMLLAASDEIGPVLLCPESEVPSGTSKVIALTNCLSGPVHLAPAARFTRSSPDFVKDRPLTNQAIRRLDGPEKAVGYAITLEVFIIFF